VQKVLITGATGFVGKALCKRILAGGWHIRVTVRSVKNMTILPSGVEVVQIKSIDPDTDWSKALSGVDAVIHLAARVHQMKENKEDPEEAYQCMNVKVTRVLAEASSNAGIKRFLFLSSVKAMGEATHPGEAWNESSPCLPHDAYGRSKFDAEKVLNDIGHRTGMDVVILRLPLVYGPGVKANMARLFSVVNRGVPLPLGMGNNSRSLLFIGNLVDAIRVSLEHPNAAGQTYLISDGEDLSTPELIRRIAQGLGRSARLFSFPPLLLRMVGRLTGKTAMVDRLLNSLVIDSSKIFRELNWIPPYSIEQGLAETAKGCLDQWNNLK